MIYKIKLVAICILFAVTAFTQSNNTNLKIEQEMQNNSVNASILIHATPTKVWSVLTNPDMVKIFIGSTITTDWQIGSPITWTGEMNGVPYKNKGKVLEYIPNQKLKHTYWSGIGGDADADENYSEITYTITGRPNNAIELTYSRTKIPTEMESQLFQGHIQSVLEEIKKIAENE